MKVFPQSTPTRMRHWQPGVSEALQRSGLDVWDTDLNVTARRQLGRSGVAGRWKSPRQWLCS